MGPRCPNKMSTVGQDEKTSLSILTLKALFSPPCVTPSTRSGRHAQLQHAGTFPGSYNRKHFPAITNHVFDVYVTIKNIEPHCKFPHSSFNTVFTVVLFKLILFVILE